MDGSMSMHSLSKEVKKGPKSAWAAWPGSGWFTWMIRGGKFVVGLPWTSQFSSVQFT